MGNDQTTITLNRETKTELDRYRNDGETWDAFLLRLIREDPPERPAEFDQVLDELERLPERTADELETRLR